MFKLAAVALGLACVVPSAVANDSARMVGTWKLVSFVTEFKDGAPGRAVYGASPSGYSMFQADGRMMAYIEGEGRKPPQSDEDRATLFKTMFAYAGTYRLEGDKLVNKVEIAWNPAWHGTEQVRYVRFEGDRIHITSAWAPSPNLPGSPLTRAATVYERVKTSP